MCGCMPLAHLLAHHIPCISTFITKHASLNILIHLYFPNMHLYFHTACSRLQRAMGAMRGPASKTCHQIKQLNHTLLRPPAALGGDAGVELMGAMRGRMILSTHIHAHGAHYTLCSVHRVLYRVHIYMCQCVCSSHVWFTVQVHACRPRSATPLDSTRLTTNTTTNTATLLQAQGAKT